MNIHDYEADPDWKPSLGEKLNKIHFRNGHMHAECDPVTGNCSTHYDENDPHESLPELVKHVWKSDSGKAAIIGGGLAIALGLIISKTRD